MSSRLHHAYITPTSRLHHAYITPTTDLLSHACATPTSRLHRAYHPPTGTTSSRLPHTYITPTARRLPLASRLNIACIPPGWLLPASRLAGYCLHQASPIEIARGHSIDCSRSLEIWCHTDMSVWSPHLLLRTSSPPRRGQGPPPRPLAETTTGGLRLPRRTCRPTLRTLASTREGVCVLEAGVLRLRCLLQSNRAQSAMLRSPVLYPRCLTFALCQPAR